MTILQFKNKKLDELANKIENINIELVEIQKEFESMQLGDFERKTFEMLINESLQEFIYIHEDNKQEKL
jgi:hypothetical protein